MIFEKSRPDAERPGRTLSQRAPGPFIDSFRGWTRSGRKSCCLGQRVNALTLLRDRWTNVKICVHSVHPRVDRESAAPTIESSMATAMAATAMAGQDLKMEGLPTCRLPTLDALSDIRSTPYCSIAHIPWMSCQPVSHCEKHFRGYSTGPLWSVQIRSAFWAAQLDSGIVACPHIACLRRAGKPPVVSEPGKEGIAKHQRLLRLNGKSPGS